MLFAALYQSNGDLTFQGDKIQNLYLFGFFSPCDFPGGTNILTCGAFSSGLSQRLRYSFFMALQHTVKHCNIVQHTENTGTHCTSLQHTATHCDTLQHAATCCNTLQHTATYCNTQAFVRCIADALLFFLPGNATHCNTLQHAATHYNTLQHTATHFNTLQAADL